MAPNEWCGACYMQAHCMRVGKFGCTVNRMTQCVALYPHRCGGMQLRDADKGPTWKAWYSSGTVTRAEATARAASWTAISSVVSFTCRHELRSGVVMHATGVFFRFPGKRKYGLWKPEQSCKDDIQPAGL